MLGGLITAMGGVPIAAFAFRRCETLLGSGEVKGVSGGGVGDAALVLAFLAFLLRIFSSSSEDVTSESLELWSMLIDVESRLFRELAPKEGARLRGRLEPAKESERMMRWTRGSAALDASDALDREDWDLFIRNGREPDMLELRVVELGVDGRKEPYAGEEER